MRATFESCCVALDALQYRTVRASSCRSLKIQIINEFHSFVYEFRSISLKESYRVDIVLVQATYLPVSSSEDYY